MAFYLFILIYLRSIAKKVFPTYFNHSRHLIPDGIHRHEGMREEPDLPFYNAERQAMEHLVPFLMSLL